MPLGIPTYGDFPSPTNPKPRGRSGGGSSRPTSSPQNTSPSPVPMPRPAPSAPPSRRGTPSPGPLPPRPLPAGPRRNTPPSERDRKTVGGQPVISNSDLMALDFTGMGATNVASPEMRAINELNRQTAEIEASNQRAMDYVTSITGQYDAWSDSQQDALQNRYNLGVGEAGALRDLNRSILDQGLNTDLGLLGEREYRDVDLARERLAGQQMDLGTYMDILAQRKGIRRDQFVTDRDYYTALNGLLGQERGLAYNQFQSNDQYAAGRAQDNLAQYGFAARDYATDMAGNALSRDTSRRAATSDAAARGAFGSSGFRDNISDIAEQFGLNADQAQLALDRANQQIGEQDRAIGNDRSNLAFGYQGRVIGFDRDAAGLTRAAATNYHSYRDDLQGFRKQETDLAAQGRDLAQTGKALDSLAREYGIKREDIQNQFQNSVTKMGLDYNSTLNQLNDMLASGNAELIARGMNFLTQLMAYQV